MNLEPKVLERIKLQKRSGLFGKILVLLPLFCGIATCALFLIIGFLNGRTDEYSGAMFTNPGWVFYLAILVLALGGAFALVSVHVSAATDRDSFESFISKKVRYHDRSSITRFKNGLEGVCIGAGVPTPDLEVLAIPNVTSFSYISFENKPVVCVTRDALRASFSAHEAEAIMANEVSRIIIGGAIEPPNTWNLDRWIMILSAGLIGFALGTMIILMVAGMGFLSYVFSVFISGALLYLSVYFFKRLKAIEHQDEVLSDSIAVKIGGNPSAFITALNQMSKLKLACRVRRTPYRPWFPRPLFPNKALLARIQPTALLSTDSSSKSQGLPCESQYLKVDCSNTEDAIRERIMNLEAIERGHWSTFDYVDKGKLRMRAGRWM